MDRKEKKAFFLLLGAFLVFYFMPTSSEIFKGALLSGFSLLNEYVREHILFCLLPAFFIAGAITAFIKKGFILKYLGGKVKKHISYLVASISGIFLAVCSCTILPLFAGIRKKGAGLGPATTFLFSGPAINIAAIFLTVSVLGVEIGVARFTATVGLSILVGISMQLIFKEKTEKQELFIENEEQNEVKKNTLLVLFLAIIGFLVIGGLQINQIIKYGSMLIFFLVVVIIAFFKLKKQTTNRWLQETWYFTKMILPILFVGVFLAGFIMFLVPQEIVEKVAGTNSIIANLVASVFGTFMYFSTLTEVPILQALIEKGMNQGPVLALLLAGPSLSLPNLLVIRKILGNKKTLTYALLVIFYSTIAGLVFGSL